MIREALFYLACLAVIAVAIGAEMAALGGQSEAAGAVAGAIALAVLQ